MKLSPLHLALVAALLPVCASAQDNTSSNVTTLDPIVVTASRTAEPLSNVVGDVSVIDGVELRKNNALTVVDILQKQPGIQTYNNGGPQTTSGTFVRGASEKQSLMMINGVRINDVFNGGAYWSALNPATFSRLEIVRGAASSLYGSNAMGGVINLISSSPNKEQGTHFFGGFGAGSFGTFKTYAGVDGAQGDFDYHLAGSWSSSDGYDATTTQNSVHNDDTDGYEQATINGALGYQWAKGQHLGISFFNGYSHNEYDSGLLTNDVYDVTRQQVYSITSTNQITPWWQSVLRFGFSKNSYFTPPIASIYDAMYGITPSEYKAASYQRQLSWQNNFFINNNNTLSTVLERNVESGVASNYAPIKSHRTTNSLAVIYQGHFNRHHIQASLRNDHYSDYGSRVTGSIGYDFDITPELSIGVAGNTGFRAPTFQEQFGTYNGNQNLKPEKSRNIEAHIAYQVADKTLLKATVFHNRYSDLITSICDASYKCINENINKATMKGVSLEVKHDFGNTQVYAGADFLSARDNSKNERLIRRARQVYRAGITQQLGIYEVGADYLFIGNRTDTDFDAFPNKTVRLGGYGLVNLRAAVNFNKQLSAQLSINNVFNKKHSPAYGYNGQGTNFFLNLSYQH